MSDVPGTPKPHAMSRTTIAVTPAIRTALEAVARAERAFVSGEQSYSVIERPKVVLADAIIAAAGRLARLPRRARQAKVTSAQVPVLSCESRRRRA